MKKILFQGDSITDAGRGSLDDPHQLGGGYPLLVASELMAQEIDLDVMNFGIGGNRIVDLYGRVKKHCINWEPDVLSILIGVNDVWHERDYKNGIEPDRFETLYRMFLEDVKKSLPNIKIIIMGAFLTKGTVADGAEWQKFYDDVKDRRDIAEKLAKEFGAEYIDLQKVFDDAEKIAPANHWTMEGVHPTVAGHQLIKNAWIETYKKLK